MIIRIKSPSGKIEYDELQVKYSKKYETWNKGFRFAVKRPIPRERFFYVFICSNENLIFIIPSIELNKIIDNFNYTTKFNYTIKKKKIISRQITIEEHNEKFYFIGKKGYRMDITDYKNRFDILN